MKGIAPLFAVAALWSGLASADDVELTAAPRTQAPVRAPTDKGAPDTVKNTQSFTEEDKPLRNRYSPWGVAYFNWATQNVERTRLGTAQLSSFNFLSLDYRLGYGSKVSFRPQFMINGAGEDMFGNRREPEFMMGDMYLQYYHYNMALLPGNIGLSGNFRVYIPTSEFSRNQSMITRVQSRMLFVKPLGYGFQATYVLEPRYYFYRNRAYLLEDGDFQAARGNKWGEVWHYLEFAERIGDKWGLSQSAGFRHQWYYDVSASNIPSRINDRMETMIGAFFDLGDVNFRIGLNNSIDIRRPRQSFRMFREDETEYSLMTYVRF